MCGFTSIYFKKEGRVLNNKLIAALAHLNPRGPDSYGVFHTNKFITINTRLEIQGNEKNGKLPFYNDSYCLSYNGEIYNFQKNKKQSDTSLLFRNLQQSKEKSLKLLNGMFAFTFYNRDNHELIFARDRIGIKPLYIFEDEEKIILSSVIKSIFAIINAPKINDKKIETYLTLRYVPGEETLFHGIKKVPPGYFGSIKNGKVKLQKYWAAEDHLDSIKRSSFEYLLNDAVKIRLSDQHKNQVLLSSGIDSVTLAALAKEKSKIIATHYVTEKVNNELVDTQKIAKELGIPINVIEGETIRNNKAIYDLELPHGLNAIHATSSLFQNAVKESKVSIIGEGADELFMGYIHHDVIYKIDVLQNIIPAPILKILAPLIKKMPISLINNLSLYPSKFSINALERLSKGMIENDVFEQYKNFVSVFDSMERNNILKGNILKESENPFEVHKEYYSKLECGKLKKIQLLDMKYWLPDFQLERIDKLSMANSHECRVPYLDHRLVEFMISTNESEIMSILKNKKYLKNQLLNHRTLKKSLIAKKKHAFYSPVQNEIESYKKILLSESCLDRNIFNPDYVRSLDFNSTNLLDEAKLVTLLNFELWCQIFFDNSSLLNKLGDTKITNSSSKLFASNDFNFFH